MNTNRYQPALNAAVDAALEAGKLLRDDFHRPGGPRGGGSHAEVDEEAERVIRDRILAAFPAAYRGEETGIADGGDPEHIWLVDPNDGTSAYLKGWRGSAISIALVRQGTLVLGVVYAPCYPDDNGDLFAWAEGCGPIIRNGRPVATNLADNNLNGSDDVPAIVFISQDADKNPAANAACVAPARFIAMPSIAYRLALVAAGEGVAAISLNSPGDWDYAGGHALLVGVGGTLVDQAGKPITYGSRGESHCQWCFGGAPAAVEALYQRDWHGVFSSGAKSAGPFSLVRPERGLAVADPGRLSRAQGCLLGQLAGDSLGGLVEFSSATKIKSKYPSGLRELMDGGHWGILAGQPTDDSELALMLARSIVQTKGYDPAAALDAYLHWYDSPPFDIGGTTSSALGGAEHGKTPQERLKGAMSKLPSDGGQRKMNAKRLAKTTAGEPKPQGVRLYTLDVFIIGGPITEKLLKRNPEISRTIQIRGDQTLEDLHHAIFDAFDRFDEHMYEFQFGKGPNDPKGQRYVLPQAFDPHEPNVAGNVAETTIATLGLKVDQSFGYWFDFGDDWWHQINVVAIDDEVSKGKYPKVVKRVGKSPPQYMDEDE